VKSPGGITFWLVEEPTIPIVSVEMSFNGGARLDPKGREGVGSMMAALLDEGAGEMDSVAFSNAESKTALRLGFSTGRDRFQLSTRMLAENIDESAALVATALSTPRFDEEPVSRIRAQMLSDIAEQQTNPDQIAYKAWFGKTFPGHRYGKPTGGTAESITAITRDDLIAAHQRLITRANALVAIVGAIDAAAAGRLVDTMLADVPAGTKLADKHIDTTPPPGLTVIELDVPQAVAVFGQAGLRRTDPDFIPAFVMNQVLGGGGFASRLMVEVREKRGLAYGVYSYLAVYAEAELMMGSVRTANARIAESLELIRAEWRRMAEAGVTEKELAATKRYLTGAFPLRFDSNAKIARFLVFAQEEKLGIDYINRRNGLIEAVTLDDIRRVAKRLLKADDLSIVVVGKPAGL